jgi:hypothetical protein
MPLAHFGRGWHYKPIILQKEAKKNIKFNLKEIQNSFESADISLNGKGKSVVFISGEPNFFKEKRTESGVSYLVYKSERDNCVKEYYTFNKKLHREHGPAYILTMTNTILEYAYFKNGELHNEDGPATMHLNHPDEKLFAYWYKNKFLTKEQFNIIQRKVKLKKLQEVCLKSI